MFSIIIYQINIQRKSCAQISAILSCLKTMCKKQERRLNWMDVKIKRKTYSMATNTRNDLSAHTTLEMDLLNFSFIRFFMCERRRNFDWVDCTKKREENNRITTNYAYYMNKVSAPKCAREKKKQFEFCRFRHGNLYQFNAGNVVLRHCNASTLNARLNAHSSVLELSNALVQLQ